LAIAIPGILPFCRVLRATGKDAAQTRGNEGFDDFYLKKDQIIWFNRLPLEQPKLLKNISSD